MSSWTKCRMTVKDRNKLFEAAKRLGLTVDHKKQKFSANSYTGAKNVDAVIKGKGGAIGMVEKSTDEYDLVYDDYNWSNSMYDQVGSHCSKLTREYSRTIVEDQVSLMGGFISGVETKDTGEIHLNVSI